MPLQGLSKEQVKSVRWVHSGAEVKIAKGWVYDNYPDVVFADLGPDPVLPDPVDTVIKVELK